MGVAVIASSNREQADAWDGDEGDYWASRPDQFDAVLEHYAPEFRAACEVQEHHRVLDVGCGTGGTALEAARRATSGRVVGVDLSARMLQVAEGLARDEGLDNLRFEQTDAQVHPFEPSSFDLVMSRTGAMFFGDPLEAFGNLHRALGPGGRLALLTWQPIELNPWMTEFATALLGKAPAPPSVGAPGPFSLSDPGYVCSLLTNAGFVDVELTPATGSVFYGQNVTDAYELLSGLLGWMLQTRAPEERELATAALRRSLEAHAGPDGVRYDSATWLITGRSGRGQGL